MSFTYNKKNAKCMWCKRTQNPHPDFTFETNPTKVFKSKKGRKIELCFSCYEYETIKSKNTKTDLKKVFDTEKVGNLISDIVDSFYIAKLGYENINSK